MAILNYFFSNQLPEMKLPVFEDFAIIYNYMCNIEVNEVCLYAKKQGCFR